MGRSSKDIAKRLRFDHRPRADAFRRWYWLAALAAGGLAVAAWFAFSAKLGERQYLPGPLTPAHATFGARCRHCHVAFAAAPDERCLACHATRPHSAFELGTPACRHCHIEHRGEAVLLAVSNQACVDCHGDLQGRRAPMVGREIATFAAHPELSPLRDARDPTALRFNHHLHLSSDNVDEELTCASCHLVDVDGRTMRPIHFETHCQRCHRLQVTEGVPAAIAQIAIPHADVAEVRAALVQGLLALGATRAQEIFTADRSVLLPGRVDRGPVDESRSLAEFQRKYVERFEEALYRPFDDTAPLLEHNKSCFLCHVQGDSSASGLPVVVETKLPTRWMVRAGFSHRRHDKMPCATCHAGIEESADTADVHLPARAVCAQCHAEEAERSAGTGCTLCHRYHESRSAPPGGSPRLMIERLLGRAE